MTPSAVAGAVIEGLTVALRFYPQLAEILSGTPGKGVDEYLDEVRARLRSTGSTRAAVDDMAAKRRAVLTSASPEEAARHHATITRLIARGSVVDTAELEALTWGRDVAGAHATPAPPPNPFDPSAP
jgi:hypothetical protein